MPASPKTQFCHKNVQSVSMLSDTTDVSVETEIPWLMTNKNSKFWNSTSYIVGRELLTKYNMYFYLSEYNMRIYDFTFEEVNFISYGNTWLLFTHKPF